MSLPQKLSLGQMQTTWAEQLNPIIDNPSNNSIILKNIHLIVGTNRIDHKLGRILQGWYISRLRASATIFDTQDANPMPQRTLLLTASAPVVADIVVF